MHQTPWDKMLSMGVFLMPERFSNSYWCDSIPESSEIRAASLAGGMSTQVREEGNGAVI
jgi:hypothetical protein